MTLQKNNVDVSKVFLAYLSQQGDPNRTALVVNMDPEEVRFLAIQEGWQAKIEQFGALREQDSELQIKINRAASYIQAQQLSTLIDEIIKTWTADPDKMMKDLTSVTKNGSSFSTKALADLVKSAETVQFMKARALGDAGGKQEEEKASGATIGLSVARAMNAVAANAGLDSVTILKKSLETPQRDNGN